MPVRLGLERLLDGPDRKLIEGQRIGLVCNPASVDSALTAILATVPVPPVTTG